MVFNHPEMFNINWWYNSQGLTLLHKTRKLNKL